MKIINKNLKIWLVLIVTLAVSCDLEEEPYSLYTPDNFYSSESEVVAAMSGVYRSFAAPFNLGAQYRVFELTADLLVVHAKVQGWWQTPNIQTLNDHAFGPGHRWIGGTYNYFFSAVAQCNATIISFESTDLELDGPIAELRALRAIAYWYLMDGWGSVPLFTGAVVDPNNLPEQTPRMEIFDFVVTELEAAAVDLPPRNETGDLYYGRVTKEAAYAFLASIYLNAEVYTGTPQFDKAVEYADLVINSGNYRLLEDYFENFVVDNDNNDEQILSAVFTPNEPGGLGQEFVIKCNFGIVGLFGLSATPQNGFAARPALYDLYEAQDNRRTMFFHYGNLIDPATGEEVLVERVVPDNNSYLYNPATSVDGPVPFNIIPATGLTGQPMNAGIKFLKWEPDVNSQGTLASNDMGYIRYADILLTKAEAILRGGGSGDPVELVNQVRRRSGASELSTVTLDDILDERARELCFEGLGIRRRDLIRYDRFTDAWPYKVLVGNASRNLFPIPTTELDANPKLSQNEGY